MLRVSVRTNEGIKAYGKLISLGLVQDDLFAERLFEEGLGLHRPFDLAREIVFCWPRQTPETLAAAGELFARLPVTPVRVWLGNAEYSWSSPPVPR